MVIRKSRILVALVHSRGIAMLGVDMAHLFSMLIHLLLCVKMLILN